MDLLKPLPALVEADLMQRCAAAIAEHSRVHRNEWPGAASVLQEQAAGAYRRARQLAGVETLEK